MIGRFDFRRLRWSPLRAERQSEGRESRTRSEDDRVRTAAYEQVKHFHPWYIVAGLGAMDRQEICEFLAVFDDASLRKLAQDKLSDLVASWRDNGVRDPGGTFRRRLTQTASRLQSSDADEDLLRLRLWAAIRSVFAREPALPLSTRAANLAAADIAHDAAAVMSETIGPERTGSKRAWISAARQLGRRALSIFDRRVPEFGAVVGMHAARLAAEAAKEGGLKEEGKQELIRRVRSRLAELPPELKDENVERALRAGDTAMLALVASGSTLVGLGLAVELAGFGAYIAAAQASAIIPLLTGKAAVSALFVLSHPLFIIPVLLGGGYAVGSGLRGSVNRRLASGLVVLLAIRGLANGRTGLQRCLDAFRRLDPASVADLAVNDAKAYASVLLGVREKFGDRLPPAPGVPPRSLAAPITGERADSLGPVLFPEADRGQAAEALAVAGLTMGDVVYTAAAIDPTVVAAVDFSRAESLESLFDFGAFAQRTSELSGEALGGAENNLCGYVAEQIVAARLVEKGHQVSLPDISNNPGYDLLIDGAGFQVKCLSDIDGLYEHFGKYSDIPVIANAELAIETAKENAPAWAGKVFFVEGYDHETAKYVMTEAIQAGAALDNLDVPIFAVAVSAARNVHSWWKGTIALADLPWEVTVDGAVKGGLAAAGGFTGKTLGLLVFGPAGAVVFGGLGGAAALLGSTSARRVLEGLLPERSRWLERTESASRDLLEALQRTLTCKRRELDRKIGLLPDRTDNEVDWLRRRLRDDRVFIAERQVRVTELMGRDMPAIDKAREALRAVHDSGVHPWTVRADIGCVLRALDEKPPVRETIIKVMKSAAQSIERHRERQGRGAGA